MRDNLIQEVLNAHLGRPLPKPSDALSSASPVASDFDTICSTKNTCDWFSQRPTCIVPSTYSPKRTGQVCQSGEAFDSIVHTKRKYDVGQFSESLKKYRKLQRVEYLCGDSDEPMMVSKQKLERMAAVAATFLKGRSYLDIANLLSSVFPAANWQPFQDRILNESSDGDKDLVTSDKSRRPVVTLSHVNDAAFRFHIFETLLADEYKLQQYPDKNGTHWIIDAGGNMGETAINYLIHFPNSKVVVIEAHPVMYVMSRWSFILNGFEDEDNLRLVSLNAAFGAPDGADMQMVDTNSFGWTGKGKVGIGGSNSDQVTRKRFSIPTISAQELFKIFDMKKIYILKMDCEGCEFSAVPSWNFDFAAQIDSLAGEYHENLPESFAQMFNNTKSVTKNALFFTCSFPLGYINAFTNLDCKNKREY
eukprot:CAMPEP_0196576034 /NCGR_PEP_ID=MMETSP1081-20130531/5397_1 /TAXON_ID=36882 /ORGANISM="Pyramimonas amylifera, Strain CCMP720" /LENGTH=418 /DNA_ID=CAMNT_0041894529 /DNA_START=590 /DNA_END=1846 /DNA_ORIENTATION=-